jgi:hypothetical protein
MSALYEKLNNIRKRINKANAIVRNLNAAKEDYSNGHYNSCLDAVSKIKTLDPEHPEVKTLEKHAERRKKGEISDDEECGERHSEWNIAPRPMQAREKKTF